MVFPVHMLCSGQAYPLYVCKKNPIEKKGVPCGRAENKEQSQRKSLHKSFRSGSMQHPCQYEQKYDKSKDFLYQHDNGQFFLTACLFCDR